MVGGIKQNRLVVRNMLAVAGIPWLQDSGFLGLTGNTACTVLQL